MQSQKSKVDGSIGQWWYIVVTIVMSRRRRCFSRTRDRPSWRLSSEIAASVIRQMRGHSIRIDRDRFPRSNLLSRGGLLFDGRAIRTDLKITGILKTRQQNSSIQRRYQQTWAFTYGYCPQSALWLAHLALGTLGQSLLVIMIRGLERSR